MSRRTIRLMSLIKSFVTELNRVNTRGDLFSLFPQIFGKIFLNILIITALAACDAKFKVGNTPGPGQSGPAGPAGPTFLGLSISNGTLYAYGNVAVGGGTASHTFTVTNNEGSWNPNAVAPYKIESLAVDSSTVYIGGTHLGMSGTNALATYFSVVDTTNGTVVNASNFVANNEVKVVDYDSNYIYLLRSFTNGAHFGPVVRVDKTSKNTDATWPSVALMYDSADSLRVVGSDVGRASPVFLLDRPESFREIFS